ncbi:hypothetical protein ACL7TT_20235 [Microbulbifer sp. 2304DJ12-6]|uniref:hypothetical protein n=1 Tax=Microbulbifer sp. 2304DJ12-6 TaxID=3233340 RepID=UPI0039B04194
MTNSFTFFVVSAAVAGYIFVTTCYKFKYKVARESGYKLYLTSLSYGIVFLGLAWGFSYLTYWLPVHLGFNPIFTIDDADEVITISILAILISLASSLLHNKLTKFSRIKSLCRVWKRNDFDWLCFRAIGDFKPIAVSHECGKVYVGYVIDTLSPDQENSHLTLLPIFSGYRAPETLQFIIAIQHQEVINLIRTSTNENGNNLEKLEDHYMAFPRNKINSLHIFNLQIYLSASSQYRNEINNDIEATKQKGSQITAEAPGTV